MYTDSRRIPVYDTQQYIAPDGTKYPWDYPKSEIPGLLLVTEVPRPENSIIHGFSINEDLVQVWDFTPNEA